jgi:hypothetical protein
MRISLLIANRCEDCSIGRDEAWLWLKNGTDAFMVITHCVQERRIKELLQSKGLIGFINDNHYQLSLSMIDSLCWHA